MKLPLVAACALALVGCHKQVPAEVRPALDSVREDARKAADNAVKACSAQFASGQFYVTPKGCGQKVLPGQTVVPTIPSPAKGTSLESNPNVVEVQAECSAPTGSASGGTTTGCSMGLDSLHKAFGPGDFKSGNWDTAEDSCKSSPSNCEKVEVPSRYAKDDKSADLTITRPVPGGPAGATATVRVTLAKK